MAKRDDACDIYANVNGSVPVSILYRQHSQLSAERQGIQHDCHSLGIFPLERHANLDKNILASALTLPDRKHVEVWSATFTHDNILQDNADRIHSEKILKRLLGELDHEMAESASQATAHGCLLEAMGLRKFLSI